MRRAAFDDLACLGVSYDKARSAAQSGICDQVFDLGAGHWARGGWPKSWPFGRAG